MLKGGNHRLTTELGGPVKRNRPGRMSLRNRLEVRYTVNRRRRREDQASDILPAHRLENVVGGKRILLKIFVSGIAMAELHVGIGRQVIDRVDIAHRSVYCIEFKQIAVDQLEMSIRPQRCDVLLFATAEIIQNQNFVTTA